MHPCFTSKGQLFNITKYLAWILCNFRHMPCKFHQHQQHHPTQHAPNLHNCDSCLRIIPGIFHRVSIMEQGVQIYMHMYPIWSVCVCGCVHMCECVRGKDLAGPLLELQTKLLDTKWFPSPNSGGRQHDSWTWVSGSIAENGTWDTNSSNNNNRGAT